MAHYEHCLNAASRWLASSKFTAEDVRRMLEVGILAEDKRFELIQGDVVMLGHNLAAHELIKIGLNVAMVRAVPDELLVGAATTLQLADDILVDADLAIMRRAGYKPSESGFAQPDPNDILLLIEIAGSNLNYDRYLKTRVYARYRVKEFWLIEPFDRITGFIPSRPGTAGPRSSSAARTRR